MSSHSGSPETSEATVSVGRCEPLQQALTRKRRQHVLHLAPGASHSKRVHLLSLVGPNQCPAVLPGAAHRLARRSCHGVSCTGGDGSYRRHGQPRCLRGRGGVPEPSEAGCRARHAATRPCACDRALSSGRPQHVAEQAGYSGRQGCMPPVLARTSSGLHLPGSAGQHAGLAAADAALPGELSAQQRRRARG